MKRSTRIDFAHCMRTIAQAYPDASVIRVVLDNLNTHKIASLYEAFPPEEARAIAPRLEFHHTPLSMAVGSISPKSNSPSCPIWVCLDTFPMKPPYNARSLRMSPRAISPPFPFPGVLRLKKLDENSPVSILLF
jgi:hypothetical protein